MDALLLREPAFVLERAHEIEIERQRSNAHGKDGSASDAEDDMSKDDAHQAADDDIQRYLEQAQALDASWPSSYVHKKLLVLQDIMEELYRPEHTKSKPSGARAQCHIALDEAPTPLVMSDLPLAMQLGLRMFFRITRSFQDPTKLATNYRLIVQVASKLPSMLASLPPLHLSPGFLDAPQSNATSNSSEGSVTEESHVYSVFQQLFKILSDLLALPWNGSASAADAHSSSTIVLTDSERATVLTAFIALSLKWGRLRHLLTGIRAVLESPDCFGPSELTLLTPLLESVAQATVELHPASYADEDTKNGFLMSFGKGDHGKLGHGQCSHAACPDGNCTENKSVPTMVNATRDQQFVKIDSLSTHSVAIMANGDVMAWGNGDKYRLGHGTTAKEYTPRVIDSLCGKGRVTDIACGLGHTIALTQTGEIYAWGNGSNGRLGLGDTTDRSNPTQVITYNGSSRRQSQGSTATAGGLSHQPLLFRRIYCGASHSLAISTDGRAFSWGKNNQGQCGHGHTNDQLSVEEVVFFRDEVEEKVVHAAGGWEHTMFCTSSGRVYSCGCGYKDSRRAGIPPVLGHGDVDRRLKPTLIQHFVDNNEEIVKVTCGWDHSLAVSSQGTIFSWGSGSNGKLGHGDEENCDVPTAIRSMIGKYVKDVKAGCEHSVMLTDDFEVWTCGQGDSGRLGHGDNQTQKSPKRIEFFAQNSLKPVSIAVGDKYNLVLVEEDPHVSGASESKGASMRAEKSRHVVRSLDEVHPRRSNSLRHKLMKDITDHVKVTDENYGAEWILNMMEAFQNPAHQEKELIGSSKCDVCLPESKVSFILFLLGHIDRIAAGYIVEGGPDHARHISYDRNSGGVKTPSMICPFSIDTSSGAISALLNLLQYSCETDSDKRGHEKKASSSRDGNGLLKICITLTCLRILKVNLIKQLEVSTSLSRSNCADSTVGGSPMVKKVDKTLSIAHALLLKLASSSADELVATIQPKQHDCKLPHEHDLSAIAREIGREAAQTLQTGFSKFYPNVQDRQRLLLCIIANAFTSSCASMETVALSGCLCEGDVMEELLLPLFWRKNDHSSNCIHQEKKNSSIESVSEGMTPSGLLANMRSLLQRNVLQAVKQLGGVEKPHMPDCYLQLFTVIQMNCFSIANQFLMMGMPSGTSNIEADDNHIRVPICSCIIDWILAYIDTLLSEALSMLKRLHKASCQHEEIVVWLLNDTFLHVLLPNAIESVCVLFQSLETSRQHAGEVAADEWESIQIRFVDQLGPYLLPIVKILDEINWKMLHLQESGRNQADHESGDSPVVYSELNERNWAVDLEDACGVLCGKLGFVVMSLSKRIRSYPVADANDQIFFAAFFASGRFLTHEFVHDAAENGQDSKILQWEEMGVFEVENELECGNNQINKNGTGTADACCAELLDKQALAMKFVVSAEQRQSSFVDWFVNHLNEKVNVRERHVDAFKKAIRSMIAVVAWYLDFTEDIRSYESMFCQDPRILVTELANTSTFDAKSNFWAAATAICMVLSQEHITEIDAANIVENANAILKLVPVSAFFSRLKSCANDWGDFTMHKMVFNLYEFLIKPIDLSNVQKLILQRGRNLVLYRLGVCLFHDLLRKLTISSTRSCLVTELLRATRKENYSISVKPSAEHIGFMFEFTYGDQETCTLEMTIENLFIRLAKQLSSHESSFDLKRKSLLAWLYLLRGKDFDSSWLARLVAKSSIVHILSDILSEEADATAKSFRHPDHDYACSSAYGTRLPAKLKSVESLIFGQSSAETLMIMARDTFYAVAMHLGRSDALQHRMISPLLNKNSSVSLSRDPSQKDVLTPRTAPISPRKRSTLPKKAIISTVEESIDQLYEFLFVSLQKLQQKLHDEVNNARRLNSLIASDQQSTQDIFPHAAIFTIGNPVNVLPAGKQTFRSRNESCAQEHESDFTLSFWICLDCSTSGQDVIALRSCQEQQEINELAVWNVIFALDYSSNTSSERAPNNTDDNYSLVVLTNHHKTSQLTTVRLMIRNIHDGSCVSLNSSAGWAAFDIEPHLPCGQWAHIAVVLSQRNVTPIVYLNGGKTNSKLMNNGSLDFALDSFKWPRLVVGGPADRGLDSAIDACSLIQDEPPLMSQSVVRSQLVTLSAVIDDVWIIRADMTETDIEFLAKQGPLLLQVKNHHVLEKDFVDLLGVISRLAQWDNTLQNPKLASITSARWIHLLYQVLEECPPDSFGQIHLLELLTKTLPHASELANIRVQSLAKLIFQPFSSLISNESGKTTSRTDICSLFMRLNEMIPGERGRCFPTLPKQNEMLYSVMQTHNFLFHNTGHLVPSNNKNTVSIESSQENANPELLMQTKSTRLFCGVQLIQDMWSSPVWCNEINEMFEMACLAAANLTKPDMISPFDSNTALALVVTMFLTAGYSNTLSTGSTIRNKNLCNLVRRPSSSEILQAKAIQSLITILFSHSQRNALGLHLPSRQDLSESVKLNGPEYIHDVDIQTVMLLQLKASLLRLLLVYMHERKDREELVETLCMTNPTFCDQLFELASTSSVNIIKSCLGADCKVALKRRGLRTYMKTLIQRDKSKGGKMVSISDLEVFQRRLWETATSSDRILRTTWRDTQDFSIKSPLAVVSGDVELHDMQVKGISHFPTVKVANAAIAAHTGLWFYEVLLVTDGLFQIGFVDCDFIADSIQGQGVGDHSGSWAFDGFRCKKWHVDSSDYGESWSANDVVGVLLDTDRMEISFFLNGRFLGVAFTGLLLEATSSLCPAISLNADRMAEINIGSATTIGGDTLSGAEENLSFRYLPILDFGNEQFSIQPVALAVQNASTKPSLCDPGCTNLDDDSCAVSETFEDDDDEGNDATNNSDVCQFRVEGGIINPLDNINTERQDSRDGSNRQLWSEGEQHAESTARQTDLMDGLVNLGFPREWAVRCATETDLSINDSGAISWILEQMEKDATAVAAAAAPTMSISSQSVSEDQRGTCSVASSILDMMMLQFGDRATRSADDLALRTASHTLPFQVHHNSYAEDQHAYSIRNLRPHTESQARNRTMHSLSSTTGILPVTYAEHKALLSSQHEVGNMNPFLCAEQPYQWPSKMPQEVYSFREASSRPLFVRQLDCSGDYICFHDKPAANDVMNHAKFAPNEVIPLWLTAGVILSVQYAREIMFSLLMSSGDTSGFNNSYTFSLKWISNSEHAIRFKRFVKVLLGLENHEMVVNTMLDLDKRSANEQSVRLQKLFLGMLSVELQRSINASDATETSEKNMPLFELLFGEIQQQILSAYSNATSPRNYQSSNASVSLTMSNALWTQWILGVLLTHVETQIRSARLPEERETCKAAMKVASSSCFSLPFFQLLASLAAGTMHDFLPWKYTAFTAMRRILSLIQIHKPDNLLPAAESTFENFYMEEQWLSEPLSKFVKAAQVDHLLELFVTRFQKEKSSSVFFTDLTRALVGLLIFVQLNPSAPSENYLPDRPHLQFYIEEFSSTHASARWSYHPPAGETAKIAVSDVATSERGDSLDIYHKPLFSLEARRQFGFDLSSKWIADKNVHIVCNAAPDNNSLPSKGSFAIRNLAPDTRYLLRLAPIETTTLDVAGEELIQMRGINEAEVFLQTPAIPPFEFDANAVAKNLIILNQNLTVKNLQNKKWRTVRTQASFDQGIHIWSVRIDTCVSKNIFIGVCTSDANLENYIGSDAFGYGFLANKAVWHNKTKLHSYGEIFKQGDIIQVTLDCDAKTLAFNRNGENLGIAASNLKFNGKTTASCRWYPAVSMYNKDDQITLVPPSLSYSTAESSKANRSQNASALPILDALQDLVVHSDALTRKGQSQDKLLYLFKKVSTVYQKWNRREIVCREIELGNIVALDLRPSTTEKYGFAHGDSIFTEMGQCIILGEYHHELWYEIVDDGKREFASWNMVACREMLENRSEFPVHRNHIQNITSIAEMPLDMHDNGVQSMVENGEQVERFMDCADFARNQDEWMSLSTDTVTLDRKVTELLDAMAVSRSLPDPHYLHFIDIKDDISDPSVLAFVFDGLECTQDDRESMLLARIGYLLFINRCIFRVIQFILPEMNTFGSIKPYVKPKEGDESKINRTSAENKSRPAVAALVTTEIAVILESTGWALPDLSDLSQLCQLSIGYLFQAQKEKLIDAELRRSATPTMGLMSDCTAKTSDSVPSEAGSGELDLPRIRIQQPLSKPIAFWNQSRTRLIMPTKKWAMTKQSHQCLFAQLSEHLVQVSDTSQLRRAYETPFDLFSIYRAFDVVDESHTPANIADASDGTEEPQDEHQKRTQNVQYLRLLECVTTEIQSPVFPLFIPVASKVSSKDHGNAGLNCAAAYKTVELDVNTRLLSLKTNELTTAQVLQWYFQFGQILGIAWRSGVKLPLQFISHSLWDHLVKPPNRIGCVSGEPQSDGDGQTDGGDPDGLCRRLALHSVRKGLLSIVPSRCLLLSTASSLRGRLCDTDLSLLSELQRHAIYDRESELHHSFWVILEELSYLERRAMHQYLTGAKASRSETLESWMACQHQMDPLGASSLSNPPSGVSPFQLEICAPTDEAQDQGDDSYPVVVVLGDHSSRLHLPAYSSAAVLYQKLMLAAANPPFVL